MTLLTWAAIAISFAATAHSALIAAYAAWTTSTISHPERQERPPWYARYGERCTGAAEWLLYAIRRRRELRAVARTLHPADLASGSTAVVDEPLMYHPQSDDIVVEFTPDLRAFDELARGVLRLDASVVPGRTDSPPLSAESFASLRESVFSTGGLVGAFAPERIPNVRFTTDLVELGNAAAALAVEAGLDAGVIVNDGMPLWFEAVDDGGYTWHFVEYQTGDAGQVLLADPDEPREAATASRAVVVTAEQVDRYYEAITIREGVTT